MRDSAFPDGPPSPPESAPRRAWALLVRLDAQWPRARLVAVLALSLLVLAMCWEAEPPPSGTDIYPSVSSEDGDVVRFEFGSGSLETLNDEAWGGRATLVFPPAVESGAGPIEFEVRGLDLSAIDYRGGLGWPADSADAGALINVGFFGSSNITYRIFSMVDGLLAERGYDPSIDLGLRAYAFHGYDGAQGPYGMHNVGLEEWGPEDDREPYNTFDVRLRYEGGVVSAWVRLHASLEWESGGSDSGEPCAWNAAINDAAPGTADSIWDGRCRMLQPGETGRPVGAWVPVEGGPWRAPRDGGPMQAGLSISNWEHAAGPYSITWRNVILRGPRATGTRWSMGGGRALAFGTGESELDPRGAPTEFTYSASSGAAATRDASVLNYRSSGFELRGESTDWVLITAEETSFSGSARVNGQSGYRFEMTGIPGSGEAPDRFFLQVWNWKPDRPFYTAFGSLTEGSIGALAADGG